MNSMTGYGRACVARDGRQLTLELKSVNHRFLDVAFRMPRSFAFLEDALRAEIAKRVSRGHIDVFATYKNMREDSKTVQIDPALLAAYGDALASIRKATHASDDYSVMDYARLPELLVISEAEEDRDALRDLAVEAAAKALDELCAMRAKEGAATARDLTERADRLTEIAREIEARYPATIAEYEGRLRARIEELLGSGMDEQRLLQEVAIMADRSAISEELARLSSHMAQTRAMIASNEAVGRKLDFIVQELNREVNTISSKSQDIDITQRVIAAKAEIEKMREQVQNVE